MSERIVTWHLIVAVMVFALGIGNAAYGHAWAAFGAGISSAFFYDDWLKHLKIVERRLDARMRGAISDG